MFGLWSASRVCDIVVLCRGNRGTGRGVLDDLELVSNPHGGNSEGHGDLEDVLLLERLVS